MESKKLNQVDYRPLLYMNSAWGTVIRDKFKVPQWIFWPVSIVLAIAITYYIGQIGFFLLIFLYAYISGKVVTYKSKIWQRFAEANGWRVISSKNSDGSNVVQPGLQGLVNVLESREAATQNYVPPGLIGAGHSEKIGDIVQATFEGHDCDVFMYQFTTGSGKNSHTHYYTIARVTLDRSFPHLILDSKHSWAIKNRWEATDSVKLEGNFNNHFSLYFNKKDHINALSVITPDVMQTLLQSNAFQDIEIIDKNLFFMIHSDVRNPEAIPKLFASVDALADQIKHKAKTLRYKPAMSPQAKAIIQAATQQARSGDKVFTYILLAIFIIIGLPFILFFLVGVIAALTS